VLLKKRLPKSHEKRYIISMKNPIKQTSLKEDAGKVLVDIGKLIFGSVFLGSILNGSIPHMFLLVGGFLVAFGFCVIGLFMAKKEKKAEENGNS